MTFAADVADRADFLSRTFPAVAVSEALTRASSAAEANDLPEAQLWTSTAFALGRRETWRSGQNS